jgi:hypothetical protein
MGRSVFIARTSCPAVVDTGQVVECLYTRQSAGSALFSMEMMLTLIASRRTIARDRGHVNVHALVD